MVGAVVASADRVLASVGKRVILDGDLRAPATGRQTLRFAEDGLRVAFDVATLIEGGSGSVEVQFKLAIEPAVLAQLPGERAVALVNAEAGLLNPWTGSYADGKTA